MLFIQNTYYSFKVESKGIQILQTEHACFPGAEFDFNFKDFEAKSPFNGNKHFKKS